MEQEHITLLKEASSEIRSLRSQNQLMKARLDMFDDIIMLINTSASYPGVGMSPDLVYKIERFITSAEQK